MLHINNSHWLFYKNKKLKNSEWYTIFDAVQSNVNSTASASLLLLLVVARITYNSNVCKCILSTPNSPPTVAISSCNDDGPQQKTKSGNTTETEFRCSMAD